MRNRLFIIILIIAATYNLISAQNKLENKVLEVNFSTDNQYLWEYRIKHNGALLQIKPPIVEIDGNSILCSVDTFKMFSEPEIFKNGVSEYVFHGKVKSTSEIDLKLIFRLSPDNAVLRYKYVLSGSGKSKLTKSKGNDNIVYFSTSIASFKLVKEVQFANYDEKFHSYILKEQIIEDRFFENNHSVMGPMLVFGNNDNSFLIAYEHGSQYGNEFLHFNLFKDSMVNISAVKGNYLNNQSISEGNEYETVWFEIAGVNGDEDILAAQYRMFMLKYISQNLESRKPYFFYNTWGRQERVKWAGNTYLISMNLKQTLEEIEQAHKMGIDVFVLDAGWFLKTGDWTVNTSENFFPDTLKQVVGLLKKYNMKLGLWFTPTVAALSSKMLERNKNYRTSIDGKLSEPFKIWETEESVSICLVSQYWKDFSDVLINLVKEYGVTYFKWDGIWQGDCDAADHDHGTVENTPQERHENDAYLQPIYMSKIIDKVCKACPEAIFDFDITEDGRSVGLTFLSSGKYFAMNNGPYYHNYDICEPWKTPLANSNVNIFVYPGPARGWFTRQVLTYDKWIPSVLFLTHYQPDEPRNSQVINIASLILGQNGIWGEILKTSPEGTQLFGDVLSKYKQIRNDITLASPVCYGSPGESVEIHEKINPLTGKGEVVIFGNGKREIIYITKTKVNKKVWHNEGVSVSFDEKGRAVIKASFTETSSKIIFFGVE
jgi:alpha-galactosidase